MCGLLADWDEETNGKPLRCEHTLRWLYGLLCLLEKPLLPDQAADLNTLHGRLRRTQQDSSDQQVHAMVSLSSALITEHFDQRFR